MQYMFSIIMEGLLNLENPLSARPIFSKKTERYLSGFINVDDPSTILASLLGFEK